MSHWTFAARPVSEERYDGVRVEEVVLRFPAGARSGGEAVVQRMLGAEPVGAPERIALDPGEADAAIEWLTRLLASRQRLPEGSRRAGHEKTKPEKTEGGGMGRLG